MSGESISGYERKRHSRIHITHNCIRKSIGIYFTPRHCFTWRRTRKTTGVRSCVSYLQKIIVTAFVDAEHFLNLWFRLQQEVFWRATAENENRGKSLHFLFSVLRFVCAALCSK